MSNWAKSGIYGGIYASSLHREFQTSNQTKLKHIFRQIAEKMENLSLISGTVAQLCKQTRVMIQAKTPAAREIYHTTKYRLKNHICRKQEIYWPVFVAVVLMIFVFASKIASAEMNGVPNNLPLESQGKLAVIGFQKKSVQPNVLAFEKIETENEKNNELAEDVAKIVKNTPMAAMIDPISEKDRTVAAFIVSIAMKESKFGVYSPKLGGRDCYNYWGFKGGGKTVAGGYTCFASPDDAVNAVGGKIEKMVAKGVRSPAQAISWKCGSSCAGHDATGVRKWISDVAINFNKINS